MTRRVGFGGSRAGQRPAPEATRPAAPSPARAQAPAAMPRPTRAAASARGGALPRWIFLVLLFPLIFAAIGIWLLVDAVQFSGVALGTEGRVIAVETDSDSDGVTYRPVFRFRTVDDGSHEAPAHIWSSAYDYNIGAKVPILYDPADLSEVRIDNFLSLWLLPVAFTAIGTLIFAVVLAVMVRQRRGAGGAAGG